MRMRFGNPSLYTDSPHQYKIDPTKNLKKNRMPEYNSLTDCYLFKAIGKIIRERERSRQLAHFGTAVWGGTAVWTGTAVPNGKITQAGTPWEPGTAVPHNWGSGRPSQLRDARPNWLGQVGTAVPTGTAVSTCSGQFRAFRDSGKLSLPVLDVN
ncbi:unnamed protein product [Sphenostylis stenocarpa]|uniref:Uncharacterized protein n=1 Tax=Sphenostylis stenocarpa TaxID=92480 RepID=A0AA86SC08_9FABA|nr:unnamed protein product [Sphenostylis stenocarpa]